LKTVLVGCCGFPKARSKYYQEFRVVELQNTFYELPTLDWARGIREEAPPDFEFAIKAWQVITHPATSPTWKKMRKKPVGNLENYGYLKPTRENIEAFEKVVELAEILNSKIIVLQTPSSMPYTEESVVWVEEFFEKAKSIAGGKFVIGWEPRGEWSSQSKALQSILSKHGILHVTDVFRQKPVYTAQNIFYTRLHGIGPGEVNYRYKYSVEDFAKLLGIIDELVFEKGYVMFNNVYMAEDAKKFREYLNSSGKNYAVY